MRGSRLSDHLLWSFWWMSLLKMWNLTAIFDGLNGGSNFTFSYCSAICFVSVDGQMILDLVPALCLCSLLLCLSSWRNKDRFLSDRALSRCWSWEGASHESRFVLPSQLSFLECRQTWTWFGSEANSFTKTSKWALLRERTLPYLEMWSHDQTSV